MAKQYAQIFSDCKGAGTPVVLPHNLTSDDFCVFLTQDISNMGVAVNIPRAYTSAKTAADFTITDGGGLMAPEYASALAVQSHSLIDVGPIIDASRLAGPSRDQAGDVWGYSPIKNLPSYRSLHKNVRFNIEAQTETCDVTIHHRLRTSHVLVFASPLTDPAILDGETTVPLVIFCHQLNRTYNPGGGDYGTVIVSLARADGNDFSEEDTKDYDIMIVGRFEPFSPFDDMVGHSLHYYWGADYDSDGGAGAASRLHNYWVGYWNTGIPALDAARNINHYMAATCSSCLIGLSNLPPNSGVFNFPFISQRDPGGNGATMLELGKTDVSPFSPLSEMELLVIRTHSRVFGGRV